MRRLLLIALVIGLALPLAACGKKNQPEPPPGSTYPRTYPHEAPE